MFRPLLLLVAPLLTVHVAAQSTLLGSPSSETRTTYAGAVFGRGTIAALNNTFAGNISEITFRTPLNNSFITLPQEAGALYVEGQAGVTNCTFVGHSTSLSTIAVTNTGSLILQNSILAKNHFASETNFITDAGHNLNSEALPQFTAPTSTNNVDPRLAPLGYYGGPTPLYPLLTGSPAIDAADDSPAPPTDQRGRIRPFGLHADIGAFESSPPFYMFGSIQGYIDPSTRITIDSTTFTIEPNGDYLFSLPQGSHSATLSATNARFRPNPWLLSATADGPGSPVTSFELHAISPDRTAEPPSFTLAGVPGEVWNLQASLDLNLWSHIGDLTIPDSGLHTLHATNNPPHLFLRVTYTPPPR